MSDKLPLCPKCGTGEMPIHVQGVHRETPEDDQLRIACGTCGLKGPTASTWDQAISLFQVFASFTGEKPPITVRVLPPVLDRVREFITKDLTGNASATLKDDLLKIVEQAAACLVAEAKLKAIKFSFYHNHEDPRIHMLCPLCQELTSIQSNGAVTPPDRPSPAKLAALKEVAEAAADYENIQTRAWHRLEAALRAWDFFKDRP
jgi:hypothetical protein